MVQIFLFLTMFPYWLSIPNISWYIDITQECKVLLHSSHFDYALRLHWITHFDEPCLFHPFFAQAFAKQVAKLPAMLKLESLDPVARKLLDGETCTLSKTVPQLIRGARPSTESATRIRREVCLFRTALVFDAPVTITSIALWGSNLLELRTTTLVLELKGCAAAVQFALDLSGPQTNFVRFLSPLGLRSHQNFELFLCDDRLRTDTSAKLDLTRLEIVHFRASPEIPGIPDMDHETNLDPTSDLVSFEFEDSETIKANKFVLAAHSTVFKRQFFGNCVEAITGRVAVTDFSSVSFRLFLSMLLDSQVAYTFLHSADVNLLNMVEVWAIADKYCADVRNIAEAVLLQSAGPQNVKELLQGCRRYRSAELLGGMMLDHLGLQWICHPDFCDVLLFLTMLIIDYRLT